MTSLDLGHSQSRKSWKRLWILRKKKKVWGEGFWDVDLGEIQELIDTTPEELTKDNLVEMSASKPVPDEEGEDIEERGREKKNWH